MTDILLLKASLLFSAAVLLVALLRWPLRRAAGAQAQYQLWLLVPAVLLAAALAALTPERPLRWQIDLPAGALDMPQPAVLRGAAELPPTPAAAPGRWVLGVWLLGGLACALAWSRGQRRLLSRRRLPAGGSAALVGAWTPRLRLPADFRARFPAAERRLILLHERLHAERGDTRWLLLALSLVALQWFNPLAWWALSRLRADMELACDAAVLRRQPQQLSRYRQALLRAQGLTLPLTATPCSSHPLIERLSMLPTHRLQTPRRGAAALLIALAAGLAYAAQPAPPELKAPVAPAAPAVEAKPAPVAPATPAVKAATLPAPPALEKKSPPAVPALAPEPPPAAGYSKLRMDVEVSFNGERQSPFLLLETFNSTAQHRFSLPDGRVILMLASGRPHRDEQRFPNVDGMIFLEFAFFDVAAREFLAKPRLITRDGTMARIEFGNEGQSVLRVDVMPRYVTTRQHDGTGALAELKREIEAGTAPAVGVRP